MRKSLLVLTAAGALATTAPAMAQPRDYNPGAPAAMGTGAVVGTAVGVGHYNRWWGNRWAKTNIFPGLERSAAASATAGFIAGVATVAFIDAATQPCRGFRALFAPFRGPDHARGCRGGEWIG